jgi:hypothetical protein
MEIDDVSLRIQAATLVINFVQTGKTSGTSINDVAKILVEEAQKVYEFLKHGKKTSA